VKLDTTNNKVTVGGVIGDVKVTVTWKAPAYTLTLANDSTDDGTTFSVKGNDSSTSEVKKAGVSVPVGTTLTVKPETGNKLVTVAVGGTSQTIASDGTVTFAMPSADTSVKVTTGSVSSTTTLTSVKLDNGSALTPTSYAITKDDFAYGTTEVSLSDIVLGDATSSYKVYDGPSVLGVEIDPTTTKVKVGPNGTPAVTTIVVTAEDKSTAEYTLNLSAVAGNGGIALTKSDATGVDNVITSITTSGTPGIKIKVAMKGYITVDQLKSYLAVDSANAGASFKVVTAASSTTEATGSDKVTADMRVLVTPETGATGTEYEISFADS
jgi:hypothetical protein